MGVGTLLARKGSKKVMSLAKGKRSVSEKSKSVDKALKKIEQIKSKTDKQKEKLKKLKAQKKALVKKEEGAPYVRANISANKPLKEWLDEKKVRTVKPTKKDLEEKGLVTGDPKGTTSASAYVRVNVDLYKGHIKGLAKNYNEKLAEYKALSSKDKAGEKGERLKNAMSDMKKKITGKKAFRTLKQSGLQDYNKGGMANKKRMGSMDYRKGGMVLIALDFKKKKGK